ncbi:hypothetical protein EIN_118290 [Entamoeba invadens IP1]|uniref:Uncharacterized protein n=1 Tax=Entamoeba invadens IP1 TaxID=370355 RepID=L7FPY1_ENTIV|nr:hypothetical protein EIN_118290 [Entamoeba invadens IP1]ELP92255.1 hypothetical protein EIN_118290 [Entamoeba invadens IP1]|eukprot:XP_004259026.1 hypothetical protein EIN_118290 [Entamoeba invadens IP1]
MVYYLVVLLSVLVTSECSNCKLCEEGKCKECEPTYTMFGDECIKGESVLDRCVEYESTKFGCKKCVEGFTPSVNGLCLQCTHVFGVDCLECEQTYSTQCSKCKQGTVLTREGACIFCSKYFTYCEECDGQTMRCLKCKNGKSPATGFC